MPSSYTAVINEKVASLLENRIKGLFVILIKTLILENHGCSWGNNVQESNRFLCFKICFEYQCF
jgi:hypothetical protein